MHKNDCSYFLTFQVIPLCLIFTGHSCLRHNFVMVREIFLQLNKNMFYMGKNVAYKIDCSPFLSFPVMLLL